MSELQREIDRVVSFLGAGLAIGAILVLAITLVVLAGEVFS